MTDSPPTGHAAPGIRMVAVLVILQVALLAVTGVEQIALGVTGTVTTADAPTSPTLIVLGAIGLVLAVVLCALAWLITKGSNTARWTLILLSFVRAGIDIGMLLFVPASRLTSAVALVLTLATAVLLLMPAARRYFEGAKEPATA